MRDASSGRNGNCCKRQNGSNQAPSENFSDVVARNALASFVAGPASCRADVCRAGDLSHGRPSYGELAARNRMLPLSETCSKDVASFRDRQAHYIPISAEMHSHWAAITESVRL